MVYRQPALLIFVFIASLALWVLVMHANYYMSYGPMTIGQENAYLLSFVGNILIVIVCVASILLLDTDEQKMYLPLLFNFGFLCASAALLASTVMFLRDPPETSAMQLYILKKFVESNENTPLMQRLQDHHDREHGALECCGIISYLDYTAVDHRGEHLNVTHIHVPDTCCIFVEPGCGKNLDYPRPMERLDKQIYHKGCLRGGAENHMKRLDFFTYAFYHYIAYTVLFVFICSLASLFSFNVIYFCADGNEVIIDGYFKSRRNIPQEIPENLDKNTEALAARLSHKSSGDVGSTSSVHPDATAANSGTSATYVQRL